MKTTRTGKTANTDPARIPAGKPRRLDPVSEAWRAGYRTLAPVRPNLAGPVLGAEVEQYLTGAAS